MLPKVDFKEHVCKCAMIFFFLLSAIDFCNITYSEEIRSRGRCICFLLVLTTLKSYQQGRNFCVPPTGKSADALICYLLFENFFFTNHDFLIIICPVLWISQHFNFYFHITPLLCFLNMLSPKRWIMSSFPKCIGLTSSLIILQQSSASSYSVQFKRISTSQTQASDTLRNLKGIIEIVVKTVDLKTLFPDFKFQLWFLSTNFMISNSYKFTESQSSRKLFFSFLVIIFLFCHFFILRAVNQIQGLVLVRQALYH